MNQMKQIISNIRHDIMMSNIRQPFIIYVGIGTAAGTFTMIDDEKIVTPDNYHQYPQVLRDMENQLGGVKKHIILIDGMLENPPHITQDLHNGFNFRKVSDTHYVDDINQIYLHIIRQYATHDALTGVFHDQPDTLNITSDLTDLIESCKEHSINMIYHDFSGRPTLPIYSYYENMIGDKHDRIIIGLGAQGDFGCYVDLTSPITSFAMNLSRVDGERHYLKICSPRYYLKNGKSIDHAVRDYPNCNKDMLHEQFTRICKDKFDELVSKVFYKLRFLKQLHMKGDLTNEELCRMFGDHLGVTISQRIQEGNYDVGFIEALEFYGPQYDSLCIQNKLQISGVDLLYQITSNAKDEYNWAVELRKYVSY